MEVKSCRVTISDMDGVAHTIEVTAATLYEAVALGLRQLQGNEWVEGIARGLNTVKVTVKNVQVEHTVTIGEFTKWLERRGGTPAEMTRKGKVREIWACRTPVNWVTESVYMPDATEELMENIETNTTAR